MKVYTSYFYQIRNFPKNFIPISTAVWDPKWFVGETKNGVKMGLKFKPFAPGKSCSGYCNKNCQLKGSHCEFLRKYEEQINDISFERTLSAINIIINKAIESGIKNPKIVFIVYETPDNPCSERNTIQKYFRLNGVECEELSYPIKEEDYE